MLEAKPGPETELRDEEDKESKDGMKCNRKMHESLCCGYFALYYPK